MLIQEYQTKWVEDFQSIKKVLADALAIKDYVIEHIGSTAVPGLAAKPVIDIDVAYEDEGTFVIIKNSLTKIGYHHNGNQGIPGREVFKRLPGTREHPLLDSIKHHLYVCRANNKEFRRHLLFRNQLRQSAPAREEYAALKCRIAELAGQDRKQYAARKETAARGFIGAVLMGKYR